MTSTRPLLALHAIRRAVRLTAVTLFTLLAGCGGDDVVQLEDYLDELEFDRPLESVKEIKVNSYRMPCAARHRDAAGAEVPPMWVQMKFDMYVIAADEDEEAVIASIERHRGLLDDTVMAVCRESSIDMLQDNNWAMLKTRLLEAVRPLLGDERVRQISFEYSAPWEPI